MKDRVQKADDNGAHLTLALHDVWQFKRLLNTWKAPAQEPAPADMERALEIPKLTTDCMISNFYAVVDKRMIALGYFAEKRHAEMFRAALKRSAENERLRERVEKMEKAAKAVIDRWETPS